MKNKLKLKKRNTIGDPLKVGDFDLVWTKMTREEQMEDICLTLSGTYHMKENVVVMGSAAYGRLKEYQDKMIEKYKNV